jgi:hypothetical protein
MTNRPTLQMMSALQNLSISSKFLLGPREDVNRVVTRRLVQREKQFDCVLVGKPILECTILVLDLLLNLSAESTCFVSTQALCVIHCIQTSTTHSVLRPFKGSLGFRIDNADGDRIVMRTDAVHS